MTLEHVFGDLYCFYIFGAKKYIEMHDPEYILKHYFPNKKYIFSPLALAKWYG